MRLIANIQRGDIFKEINLETPKNNELSKPTLSGDLNSNILEN